MWGRYKKIVVDFLDSDVGKKVIIWKKAITTPSQFGEDSPNTFYPDIQLEVLVGDNFFRTWPINRATLSGELDNQNCSIWVSAKKLLELGYLNSNGYWAFDKTLDRFIIDGITYKTSGDTETAQAKDTSLLFMVVLKREEIDNSRQPIAD